MFFGLIPFGLGLGLGYGLGAVTGPHGRPYYPYPLYQVYPPAYPPLYPYRWY
ncbi:MAG: hypothetical protein WA131_03315 [Desulfitobacteriaceae bacterium]